MLTLYEYIRQLRKTNPNQEIYVYADNRYKFSVIVSKYGGTIYDYDQVVKTKQRGDYIEVYVS
jgi:hypothetical protein